MSKKSIIKKAVKKACGKGGAVDLNPMPRFGFQKKGGKTFLNTPIQPGSWPNKAKAKDWVKDINKRNIA